MGSETKLSLGREISTELEDLLAQAYRYLSESRFEYVIDKAEKVKVNEPLLPVIGTIGIEAHATEQTVDKYFFHSDVRINAVIGKGALSSASGIYSCVLVSDRKDPIVLVIDTIANGNAYQLQVIRPLGLNYRDIMRRYAESHFGFEKTELEYFEHLFISSNDQVEEIRRINGGQHLNIEVGQQLVGLPIVLDGFKSILRDKMGAAVARLDRRLISA